MDESLVDIDVFNNALLKFLVDELNKDKSLELI